MQFPKRNWTETQVPVPTEFRTSLKWEQATVAEEAVPLGLPPMINSKHPSCSDELLDATFIGAPRSSCLWRASGQAAGTLDLHATHKPATCGLKSRPPPRPGRKPKRCRWPLQRPSPVGH
jgi:hypothetical protein